MDKCPKCDNTIGFAFGTCVRCGWNHIDNTWRYIKVDVDYLPNSVRETLIKKHEASIKNIYK